MGSSEGQSLNKQLQPGLFLALVILAGRARRLILLLMTWLLLRLQLLPRLPLMLKQLLMLEQELLPPELLLMQELLLKQKLLQMPELELPLPRLPQMPELLLMPELLKKQDKQEQEPLNLTLLSRLVYRLVRTLLVSAGIHLSKQ